MKSFPLLKFFNDQLGSNEIKRIEVELVENFHLVREIFNILRDCGYQNDLRDAKIVDGCIILNMEKKEFAKTIENSCDDYKYGKKSYKMTVSRKGNMLIITSEEK